MGRKLQQALTNLGHRALSSEFIAIPCRRSTLFGIHAFGNLCPHDRVCKTIVTQRIAVDQNGTV